MNDKQIAAYIKVQKDKIKAWQSDWQLAFEAGISEETIYRLDERIKTIKSSLSDFMDVLDKDEN